MKKFIVSVYDNGARYLFPHEFKKHQKKLFKAFRKSLGGKVMLKLM